VGGSWYVKACTHDMETHSQSKEEWIVVVPPWLVQSSSRNLQKALNQNHFGYLLFTLFLYAMQ